MDAGSTDKWAEVWLVVVKIAGAVAAAITFRWMIKIFAGKDGKLDATEFRKFAGFLLFAAGAIWIFYKEGTRDHEWHLFSEWHLAIVSAGLLTVLHLDKALDSVAKITDSLVRLKFGGGKTVVHSESVSTEEIIEKKDTNEA